MLSWLFGVFGRKNEDDRDERSNPSDEAALRVSEDMKRQGEERKRAGEKEDLR